MSSGHAVHSGPPWTAGRRSYGGTVRGGGTRDRRGAPREAMPQAVRRQCVDRSVGRWMRRMESRSQPRVWDAGSLRERDGPNVAGVDHGSVRASAGIEPAYTDLQAKGTR